MRGMMRAVGVLVALLFGVGEGQAQSWTAPRTWVTSELVTAALLNTHLRDNLIVLRAGGVAIASQGANEIIYATSSTQLGRSVDLTFNAGTFAVRGPQDTNAVFNFFADQGDDTVDQWRVTNDIATAQMQFKRLDLASNSLILFARGILAPLQPGFLAYNSSDDTTQSSGATVDFDTEVYDEGGDFATDTFTAPVTGRYLLTSCVWLQDGSAAGNHAINLVTSNRTYHLANAIVASAADRSSLCGAVVADMDAADTATVQVILASGTITVAAGGAVGTFFSGRLLP